MKRINFSRSWVKFLVMILGVTSQINGFAQECNSDDLYDAIVSAYHQSFAKKSDGSWSAWGQLMASNGTGAVLSPQDVNSTNYPAMTGVPLLASTASGGSGASEQSVLLTTTGLFVWGAEDVIVNTSLTSSAAFQALTINGVSSGLPSGVLPTDVSQLFATDGTLSILTNSGSVYILGNSNQIGGSMLGDGTSSVNQVWHQVKTNSTTFLSNVVAVRGHNASSTKGAMMALCYNGTSYTAYTWGPSAYLGGGGATAMYSYATAMTLPSGTPKMIGVTGGNSTSRNNSYFVLMTNGSLFSLGANDAKQLGDFSTSERRSWVNVKKNATTNFSDVKYLSVQEHDAKYPAAAVITTAGDLYIWGENNGNMLGAADGTYNPFLPGGFTSGTDIAKFVEVGGHTTVYVKENSAKFCYVGHRTNGSMGDGTSTNTNETTFNCSTTPNINICGSSGWDYGDAPFAYENGGGSNLAFHFYVSSPNSIYLGASGPIANDDTPKSVVIATDNNGSLGDGTEENSVASFPAIGVSSTTYSFNISLKNSLGSNAYLYVWVDWNNNRRFESTEVYTTTVATNASLQTKTASFSGLSGLTEGRRYVRIRLTSQVLTDVAGTTNWDERALGFASDGEMEDFNLVIGTLTGANVPPTTSNVTHAGVILSSDDAMDIDNPIGADSDGTVVAYRVKSLPTKGTLYKLVGLSLFNVALNQALTVEEANNLNYDPSGLAEGEDSFQLAAIDEDGAEDATPATYTINISCSADTDGDGICDADEVPGCTNPLACNYNASATDENGTCTYPVQTYLNCAGNCINDTDNDGICNELEVPGCTDPLACNYNASATDNNGSYTYPAQTYLNCSGNCINDTDNDGVCNEIEVPGCTDPEACNYNALATDENGTCTYPTQTYLNCDGTCINDTDNDGVCNEIEVPGCTDPEACNYNASATDENGTCTYPTQTYLNCDGTCINDADNDGICNELEVPGCTDPLACNFNAVATDDNETCTYPTLNYLDCEGNCLNDSDLDGICNEEEIGGCTDEAACNYNATATDDNGSCEYASLTYYVDADGDGFGAGDGALYCSDPGAGFTLDNTDCDDSNASISPSAVEVCNEVDDDCDVEVDEFVTTTFYADADGDGFGNATDAIEACEMPEGYIDNQEDCDDNLLTYQDNDGDGMGTNVPDACGSISNEDCDDSNNLVFLGAEEICENGIDEDCDGQDLACPIQGCMDTLACNYNPLAVIDNETCTYPASSSVGCNGLCIEDTDGDGICNPDEIVGCTRQDACNYNPLATDENDPSCIYPEATYLNCDGTCINDVDSDGVCDELEVVGCQDEAACNYNPLATDNATCEYASLTYYVDADGDGVGTDETVLLCEVPTSGFADHPGDCNDNNASVYAGAVEICNDTDDDCDSEIDEGVLLTFYADVDGDGFGDNNASVQGCVAPEGYVNNDSDCDDTQITYTDLDGDGYGSEGWVGCGSYFNTDCDDSNDGINPLQSDICGNGIDEDCSGSDEVCPLIVANDNTYSLNEDDANVVLDVLSNDQGTATTILPSTLDLDVNTPGVQTTVTTSAGTWISNGSGQVIFTPNPNYNSELFGDAVLTYQVSDANGVISNIATVTVEIAPVEDNPLIVEEMIDSITPYQTPVEICLNAVEVDVQDNFIINVFGPNDGILTELEDTNYCFTYTPNDNFSGLDSIAIIMCDSGSGSLCDTVWITINVGLGAPIAHNDFATISEDEIANIDLLSNDDAGDLVIDANSVDLDPATPGIQQAFTSVDGLWSVDGNGGLTFTPNPNFNGFAMITYTVSDTTGAVSNVAMITVEVLPINDGPVVNEENGPIVNETNFEEPIVVCIDAVDVDGDELTLSTVSGPANGTLNQETGLCFEYIPNGGFTGLDSVTIVVCDNGIPTQCDTVVVYINVVPTAPVAVDDIASVDEDASVIIPILENDITNGAALDLNTVDLDVNTPGIQNTITTAEGTWTVDGLGTVTFTPVANFNGNASLNYQVTDVIGNTSNSGIVNVTVNPINDAPNGPISVTESTPFETPATVCIDPSLVIDIDGDQVSVTSVLVNPTNGVVSGLNDGDLCFTYVPNNNFTGIDSMLVTICDNGTPSLCDTVWAYVLIGGSAPIAQDDYVNSNTATVSIDVALNDQIPGDVGYTVSVVDSTSNGAIVLNGSLVSYTPDFGFCGVDSMLYSICNDMGMCDTAMLIIDVTPTDADLDGISDFYETLEGDADADGTPNYLDDDSDNDGLTDFEEAGTSSLCDANFKDCDQDGTPDYLDFFTCGVALEIPEGFSPNGDNTNDTWVIPGVEEFPENTMTVFNRWGAQVYSKAPYDNSWDGTCSENAIGSNLLPEGTYFFVFKTGPNGETKNGYVYIKR